MDPCFIERFIRRASTEKVAAPKNTCLWRGGGNHWSTYLPACIGCSYKEYVKLLRTLSLRSFGFRLASIIVRSS
jgi:hypothetical protein